jgi:mannose-6-phosphate isomerase-like protein (cupin superfamily)
MTGIVPRIGKQAGTNHLLKIKSSNDNTTGAFTNQLIAEDHYKVSHIKVPGHYTLPLQTTADISRHMTVLAGIVHITLGDDVMALVGDESLYIPQGVLHGIENRSGHEAVIVSVDYHG